MQCGSEAAALEFEPTAVAGATALQGWVVPTCRSLACRRFADSERIHPGKNRLDVCHTCDCLRKTRGQAVRYRFPLFHPRLLAGLSRRSTDRFILPFCPLPHRAVIEYHVLNCVRGASWQ